MSSKMPHTRLTGEGRGFLTMARRGSADGSVGDEESSTLQAWRSELRFARVLQQAVQDSDTTVRDSARFELCMPAFSLVVAPKVGGTGGIRTSASMSRCRPLLAFTSV